MIATHPPRHFKIEDPILTGPLRPAVIYQRALNYVARNPWMRDGEKVTLWEKALPKNPSEIGRRIYLRRSNGYVGIYAEAGGRDLRRVHSVGMVERLDGPMQVMRLSTFVSFLDWLYGILPEMIRKTQSRAKQIDRAEKLPGLWVN